MCCLFVGVVNWCFISLTKHMNIHVFRENAHVTKLFVTEIYIYLQCIQVNSKVNYYHNRKHSLKALIV